MCHNIEANRTVLASLDDACVCVGSGCMCVREMMLYSMWTKATLADMHACSATLQRTWLGESRTKSYLISHAQSVCT